ncbi:MAG: FUSC family protein [Anaerolineae bacterium]|nr:FUSC family protein [Anaerolineae bacterium]
MKNMSMMVLSIFTYMLIGYLVGLITGLTVFEPNSDIYALLGIVLALIGLVLGLLPFFWRRVNTAFGVLIGYYLGMLIAILIWGNPQTDNLLEFTGRGEQIILALITAAVGGFLASRWMPDRSALPALALLLSGFLGGLIFIMIGIAPANSLVGVSPFVIGSGLVAALIVWFLTKDRLVIAEA